MTDPYSNGILKVHPYVKKKDVTGELVAILEGSLENRGLHLIKPISRVLCEDEIHEIIVTDEQDAAPGKTVNAIAYLGFFEVKSGGVIVTGDEVYLKGHFIGTIAGFDETHMPNHINIIIKAPQRFTGIECDAELGMQLLIKKH